jgi:hypothetical protein
MVNRAAAKVVGEAKALAIRRAITAEVITQMGEWEKAETAEANASYTCCMGFGHRLRILGAMVELPIRLVYHWLMFFLFAALSAVWWPLLTACPSEAGMIYQGWAWTMKTMYHHQVSLHSSKRSCSACARLGLLIRKPLLNLPPPPNR